MPEFTETLIAEHRVFIRARDEARLHIREHPTRFDTACRAFDAIARYNYPAALDEIERLQKLAGGIFEHNVEDKCVVEYVTYKQLFEEALAIILLKK